MTKAVLKQIMIDCESQLKSGLVVKHEHYDLFINKFGNYVSVIDLNTGKEIFPE